MKFKIFIPACRADENMWKTLKNQPKRAVLTPKNVVSKVQKWPGGGLTSEMRT